MRDCVLASGARWETNTVPRRTGRDRAS